ncbi:protein mono-ADP-ribosyltransferase PARP10 isoform X2 [Gouania willdenowi]|uniref:protein mono-ADP-ribosyltransferase PARP10 isoform X2 n=1 Tax=Gouania willdenowi TaxID=441366 RepID=UPI00105566A8|nr:protein mono-ADP-ribosyltransferase PARP10 isoform X2 [Gouania willdenowi]
MAAESLEERMVEVLGLPEELDEELLWLFFENRRRSGGGTLESVKKNGHRAILVFSAAEDASRVLSKQPHNLCNCELRVRKPVTKDQHRLLLQGVSPNTSMEMIELYVENMLGLNVQEYILNPSPDRDVILIQLNQPLSKDFQTVSTKISRRTLDGTRVTLEEVEHTDSVLVENLPPSTCPDFLTLYFEGSRGGNQRVNEVTMLSEATAKVSFVNFESVDCILDMSHKLEGVDLLVKPYFGFLLPKQLPTSEQCEKEIQDDTVMNSVHPNDFQTEVSHSTETSYCARDQKAVEVLGAFEVVDEVTQDIIEETVDTDAQQSHNAITNPAEQSLDPCCTVQQDLKEIHGLAVACQTAEELLQGVVSSILSRTITVNAPGVTRFLREKECESILKEMETKFQVSITLQHEPWEPLNNLDFFDMAWKMMTQENFQKVSSPEHRSASVHNVSKGAPDKGLLEEAKKIVLTINENQKKCVSSSEHSNDIDDLDLYTADSPTGPIAQADIDVIEDSLLLAKDSSASGSTSLRDGGPNLSCYLDEEVQLSLAIQYSLDSSNWSQDDEDEQLQKALDLSNKMSQCDSVSVKNFEENLLQDNISSRFNNAVCAANVVKLVVFAGYSSDLSRVDIAFRKKVDLRQISEKIEHRNINKMSKYHWKCVEVLKRIHAVEIQVTGLILTVSGFADYVSEAMLDVKRLVDQISTSIPDKEILRTIQWERRESATSHMSLYSADATLFIEKAWKIKLDKVNIQLNNQPHVINFERMQEINVASGKTVEISRKELDQLNEEVPEGEYSLLSNFPEAIKLDVVSDEFQNVVKNFYSTLHEYNNRIRIVQVEKLSNRLLYNQYNLKKASIKKNASYPEIERTLYHGTSETCVKEICTHGFNRSFCGKNATVYGQGVYFAVDSALSVQDKYSPPNNNGYKFVLVSKVLTGDYTKGCHSMKTAPLKETGIIPLRYDSVTDEINKPTLFVIFNDTQAFPEYLITCQRIFMS